LGWIDETNEYEKEKKRHSDVYVFCVLKHMDQKTINPLDLNQWEFYVISTSVLDALIPTQKTITLSRLIESGAIQCNFNNLKTTIKQCV